MLRFLPRLLLVTFTLAALLGALFQGVGRLAFRVLDRLEPAVNEMLSSRDVRVVGLTGDWRLLNPIVRLQRLELPAGEVADVFFELDVPRSVLFGHLVARRVRVGNLDIALEKAPGGGWRLSGTGGGAGSVDVLRLVEEVNQLELAGMLRLMHPDHPEAALRITYLGINRGDEHRHRLQVWNAGGDCESPCELQVDYHGKEGIWPLREPQQRVLASASNFTLPRALLTLSAVKIDRLDLRWRREEQLSGGALTLSAAQLGLPDDAALSTELEGAVRGSGEDHQGSLSRWEIRRGGATWNLPVIALRGDGEVVQAWMETLDLGTASQFLEGALSGIEPAERWLAALKPAGRAHNLRGYVRFPSLEYGYAATVDGVALDGFKGAPYVRNASGELLGFAHGLQLDLNAQQVSLQFPDLFKERWELAYAQGRLQAWFGGGRVGLRGLNVRAKTGGSRAVGGFALSRPQAEAEQSLTLLVAVDGIDVLEARAFVPYRLPPALLDWVETAPQEGFVGNARFAYQGQLKISPGELARRAALTGELQGVRVRYHPDWPEVRSLRGQLDVAGSTVTVDVDEGESAGVLLGGSHVVITDNARAADVALEANLDAGAALDFARYTPLSRWLSFIRPEWVATGPLHLEGDLHVPLASVDALEENPDEIAVRLRADLRQVDVDLPDYRLGLRSLAGTLRYRFPFGVEAEGVRGLLFDRPVVLRAHSAPGSLHLLLSGEAAAADVWSLAGVQDPEFAEGTFRYAADLSIGTAPEVVTQLDVNADLEGLALDLPGPYRKGAEESLPLSLTLQFLPDYRVLSGRYREVSAWLHVADAPLRGAVGFGRPAPTVISSRRALVLSGQIPYFALDEVLPRGQGGLGLPLAVQLENLGVQEIRVGEFSIEEARLDGDVDADGFDLAVQSSNLSGTFRQQADSPMVINLQTLLVPVDETPAAEDAGKGEPVPAVPPGAIGRDPLTPAVIAQLPMADVVVEHLLLGSGDYGRWSFGLRPEAGKLRITDLQAEVRGVRIDAPEGLTWNGERNETRFVGELVAEDLRDVLPRWGYAPQLETASAFVGAEFTWPGSPAAVDMLRLRGKASVRADDGRFLEVESASGTLAVFSLLNFTAIAKRISLDFSDVSGRGISFDRLRAQVALDRGVLSFVEPMQVEGTGSNFRVAGSVDLNTGELDNEMIVTLPVSKSLPWYGAYIALANPIAGLGVLVGERVLRKPLEQFSSARYDIGGTLEDPQVKLVSVFDTSMSETLPAAAGEADDGAGADQAPGDAAADGPGSSAVTEPAPGGQSEQTAVTVTDE